MALTQKQETFSLAVHEGRSQADAYRLAYDAEKMSDNAIYVAASKLMDNPKVAQRVAQLRKAAEERTGITVDRVLHELASIAFADIRDVVQWDDDGVELAPSDSLTREQAAAIREVKVTKTTTSGKDEYEQTREQREVKMYDKQRALELIGKHLGLFKEEAPEGERHLHLYGLTNEQLEALASGR